MKGLYNITKKKKIIDEYKKCKSIFSKGIGLMFRFSTEKALVFMFDNKKRNSLHMMFVFFMIDVLFLDENMRIVEIKENFLPFTMYIPKNKSKYVIELPTGFVKKSNTQVFDKIEMR